MREKRNTVKTNNQELLTRKENESDATSRWTLVQKTNLFKEQRLSRKYHNVLGFLVIILFSFSRPGCHLINFLLLWPFPSFPFIIPLSQFLCLFSIFFVSFLSFILVNHSFLGHNFSLFYQFLILFHHSSYLLFFCVNISLYLLLFSSYHSSFDLYFLTFLLFSFISISLLAKDS